PRRRQPLRRQRLQPLRRLRRALRPRHRAARARLPGPVGPVGGAVGPGAGGLCPGHANPADGALMRTLPAALLLAACSSAPPDEVVDEALVPLAPRQQLTRVSLDLRGVPPELFELDAIEADPALYEGFVDRYLSDVRFGDTVEVWFNEHLRTRTGD